MPRKKAVSNGAAAAAPVPVPVPDETAPALVSVEAAEDTAPAPASESNASTICFGARFLDGYPIRRLFDMIKTCCSTSQIMLADSHMRIQSKNAKTAADATFFVDAILIAQKLGAYEFHPPSSDVDILVLNQAPSLDVVQAMKDIRKKKPFTLSCLTGENRLRITEDNLFHDPDYIDLLAVCDPPVDPPSMGGCEQGAPNFTQSVTEFCSIFSIFLRRGKYVEATIFPDAMFCRGFSEENRIIKEKWFRSEGFGEFKTPEQRAQDEKPPLTGGTKFILPRKFINVIANIKPITHDKSTVRIYHTPGSPIQFSFDIANIGYCNIYIRNEFKTAK